MRKKLIAGNWKMNGSLASVVELAFQLSEQLQDFSQADVAVFPSFVHLSVVRELLRSSSIALGAQTVSEHAPGAFTGEVDARMLCDLGCRFVLVGHSERRALFHETDEVIAQKFIQAQSAGLTPVLCVGETLAEREAGQTSAVVLRQLKAVLLRAGIVAFSKTVIAYEPVWAIGTGKTAMPEEAQTVHAILRQCLAEHDMVVASTCRILYGGSVKPDNAVQLLTKPDIDGALVGGASLKPADFVGICRASVHPEEK